MPSNETYYQRHKEKILEYRKTYIPTYRFKKPEKYMLAGARRRARSLGLEYNIDETDIIIPKICPILDVPLFFSEKGSAINSPSLDRVDNTKGYIKGNVRVISWRANTLKANLDLDILDKLTKYMKKEI